MGIVNAVLIKIFDILFLPFRGMSPWAGMIFVSLLTSFLMLFIFRKASNQGGIRKTKNIIKAHLLELRLYKDNMAVSIRSQGRILLANLKYIGYNSKPMLVMIVPILLMLIQLNLWFGSKSLEPGESVLVKVRLAGGQAVMETPLRLEASPQVVVETPPLRIEDASEIDWRIRAAEQGEGTLTLAVGDRKILKEISVRARPLSRISAVRPGARFLDQLFNPGEKALPRDSAVRSIEVRYQGARMNLFGWHVHWLIVYFVLSIIFGFSFKGLFKVEI